MASIITLCLKTLSNIQFLSYNSGLTKSAPEFLDMDVGKIVLDGYDDVVAHTLAGTP